MQPTNNERCRYLKFHPLFWNSIESGFRNDAQMCDWGSLPYTVNVFMTFGYCNRNCQSSLLSFSISKSSLNGFSCANMRLPLLYDSSRTFPCHYRLLHTQKEWVRERHTACGTSCVLRLHIAICFLFTFSFCFVLQIKCQANFSFPRWFGGHDHRMHFVPVRIFMYLSYRRLSILFCFRLMHFFAAKQ